MNGYLISNLTVKFDTRNKVKFMPRTSTLRILITLLAALFGNTAIAGPVIKLCLEFECKHPAQIEISDSTWAKVKDLYKTPFQSDKDEQDNIISSISLIEKDIYTSLAEFKANNEKPGKLAHKIYADIGIDNKYRNLKNILAPLLDHHLITQHFLRNTIKLKSWAGIEKNALLLQSLNDSQLYLLQIIASNLGNSVAIMPYSENNTTQDTTVIRKNSNTGNNK